VDYQYKNLLGFAVLICIYGKKDEALRWLADKFEPRFDEANQRISLESNEDLRFLPVFIEDTDARTI